MQTANETVINVQELEPRLRHATIFKVFDELQAGESLIIHNNHDPQPVFYQLMDMRGNIFNWEYLEQGPQWWDIRVTKLVGQISDNVQEFILNVPGVKPESKHAAIFQVFKGTDPGESFIIHNDHDPKPVYHQLQHEFGDSFDWEYINEGPQWWDVRVSIRESAPQTNENGDVIVNVPSLEPRLKHPTIFKTFDELLPGKSMIIHNDHDPKPVYYQLRSERGDVFTWEYLQQGPQWWDIRVTRKGESEETIGQIVANDLRKAEVFKKFGIDFCCNGKKTLKEACAAKGIDPAIVEAELRKPIDGPATGNIDFSEWEADFLADYIVNTHHRYVKKYMPEIKGYAVKVAQVHGGQHPELKEIRELFDNISEELTEHMKDEEGKLFPLIKQIVKAKSDKTAYSAEMGGMFRNQTTSAETEHDSVGRAMEEIRKLSNNFAIPDDACTSYKLLFRMFEEFESDLFKHIHLENNILFPKAEEILKTIA